MNGIWEKIETWFFVSVVTLLVWVYAEGENVKQHEVGVTVKAQAPGPDVFVSPADAVNVRLTVRCSQSQLTQLKAQADRAFEIPIAVDPDNVVQTVDVKPALERLDVFVNLGVNVVQTDPVKLSFNVEQLESVVAEVRVVAPEGVQLASGTTVEPARATVKLPRRFARLLGNQKLEARLDMDVLQSAEVNLPHTVDVPLTVPAAIPAVRATVTPATAKVGFTIRKQTDTLTIASVPVVVVMSPILLQRFDVTVSPEQLFVRDVMVSGPSDAIRKIRDGDEKVMAELRLSAAELEQGIDSAAAWIELPAGVSLLSPTPRVSLTVKPRTSSVLSP